MVPQITVSIVSWLLEGRLIKTLSEIPKSTDLPLNLCLQVQGCDQISKDRAKEIVDVASSNFVNSDVFFTAGNRYIAKTRASIFKRSARTPFIFMTDNDMVFQEHTIDILYNFLSNKSNSEYGLVDTIYNKRKYHRTVDGTKVICTPITFGHLKFVDVNLIGGGSMLIRSEVATIPNIIDTRYDLGTWDFDLCMNVRKAGWKIASLSDGNYVALNDHSYRTEEYKKGRVPLGLRSFGARLFESKWGFSSEYYPESPKIVKRKTPINTDSFIISRAIYTSIGEDLGVGILSERRLELMQRYFIGSLRNQTDPNFTLYLFTGPSDNEATSRIKSLDYGNLDVKFISINDDLSKWKKSVDESRNWGREIDEGSPEALVRNYGHPKATIMARVDIDDWVAPGWIAHMKHMAIAKPESHFLINYQVVGQGPDGRLYKFFAPHIEVDQVHFLLWYRRKNHGLVLMKMCI